LRRIDIPYTPAQRKLFNAMANDPAIAEEHGVTRRRAGELAAEANKLKREGKEKANALSPPPIDLEPIFGAQPKNPVTK
jgi:hypothetical protein